MSSSKIFKKVDEDIRNYGFHVLSVACSDSPDFSYTVGFEQTLNHPEVIMSGLDRKLMHRLLNDIGELIRKGDSFSNGEFSDKVVDGFSVKFISVKTIALAEYLSVAKAHYKGKEFRALQCVWPDKNGLFQTEDNEVQEVFG